MGQISLNNIASTRYHEVYVERHKIEIHSIQQKLNWSLVSEVFELYLKGCVNNNPYEHTLTKNDHWIDREVFQTKAKILHEHVKTLEMSISTNSKRGEFAWNHYSENILDHLESLGNFPFQFSNHPYYFEGKVDSVHAFLRAFCIFKNVLGNQFPLDSPIR